MSAITAPLWGEAPNEVGPFLAAKLCEDSTWAGWGPEHP